jgi:RNA polymerase sigma-70 factor (ECF subfamily)
LPEKFRDIIRKHFYQLIHPVLFLKIIHRSVYKRKKFEKLPDEEIISIYKQEKETEILEILFDRYVHLVFGVCMKYLKNPEDARDAGMEIFENLLESLLVHKIENFVPWLHKVSRNHCLMKLRKKVHEQSFEDVHSQAKENEKYMEYEQELHLFNEKEYKLAELEKALEQINRSQQVCIRFFFLENKSYTEVAELTGFSLKQVKSHLQNGKRNLKSILTNNDQKA